MEVARARVAAPREQQSAGRGGTSREGGGGAKVGPLEGVVEGRVMNVAPARRESGSLGQGTLQQQIVHVLMLMVAKHPI